jgi:DNA-binding response OmpR family regulator
MKRVLLIDDSLDCQTQIKKVIGDQFQLVVASTLIEANRLLQQSIFDMILSETHMPDGDGFQFCSDLKGKEAEQTTPVIFLSERGSITEKIKGFSVGADDYLVKPFEPLELEMRMKVRMRKNSDKNVQEQLLQKSDLILSVPYQKAILKELNQERDLRLTPTEFRLLYFFIKNEGQILTRNQLLSTVWSDDVHVLTRTIDKHISTLKKKLGSRSSYIQSVHSRGYRFSFSRVQIRASAQEELATL